MNSPKDTPLNFELRKFSIYLYWVSHGLLLLRSGISNEYSSRVDVLFRDVIWMSIPAFMNGLVVSEVAPSGERLAIPPSLAREVSLRRTFKLTTENVSNFVVAGTVSSAIDNLEYFAASSLLPELSSPNRSSWPLSNSGY